MKHTTSRKKMLLSSVAMLLVAMMALGTATFAWFTQNTTVTANGLDAKAAASSGIKILSDTKAATLATEDVTKGDIIADIDNYLYTTTLDTSNSYSTMDPASIDLSQTTAVPATAWKAQAAATNSPAKTDADYTDDGVVYTEKVYVALDNADDANATETVKLKSIAINSPNDYAMAKAVRVAIYYTSTTYDSQGTGTTTTSLVGAYSNDATAGKYVKSATATDTYTFKSSAEANAGTVTTKAGECFFTVKVYLDGEHSTVFTDNIVKTKDLINSINLQFGI